MFNLTPAVRVLLLLNVALYFLSDQLPLAQLELYNFASPHFRPWQLVTYMFLHGGVAHLFNNMLSLFFFGGMLEQRWGTGRFVVFYLVCGAGAGLLYNGIRLWELHQIAEVAQRFIDQPDAVRYLRFVEEYGVMREVENYSRHLVQLRANIADPSVLRAAASDLQTAYEAVRDAPMLGASGAVFGILFAFAYLFPNTLLYFYFFIPIKAKYFVFLYGAYELYAGVHRTPGDNVAHFAHLGGMFFGFLLLKYWERTRADFY